MEDSKYQNKILIYLQKNKTKTTIIDMKVTSISERNKQTCFKWEKNMTIIDHAYKQVITDLVWWKDPLKETQTHEVQELPN